MDEDLERANAWSQDKSEWRLVWRRYDRQERLSFVMVEHVHHKQSQGSFVTS